MTAIEERFVEVASARVRVLERPGDGDPVLFLHGITSSARTWDAVPGAAAGRGCAGSPTTRSATASPSCGGRGGRSPTRTTPDSCVEVADELGIERFAGVGHSMGCAPLLRVAWQRPERVRGLLLESPTALGRPKLDAADAAGPLRARQMAAAARRPAADLQSAGAGDAARVRRPRPRRGDARARGRPRDRRPRAPGARLHRPDRPRRPAGAGGRRRPLPAHRLPGLGAARLRGPRLDARSRTRAGSAS